MDDIRLEFELPPAPSTFEVAERMKRLGHLLDELESASDETKEGKQSSDTAACMLLRRRLAVRGWVSPLCLLDDVSESERDDVLRTVGLEVELSERTRPGQWFMTLSARKRVFGATAHSLLREASASLYPGDKSDPVRLALLAAMEVGPKVANASVQLANTSAELVNTSSELLQAALVELPPDALANFPQDVLRELSRMAAWGSSLPGLVALAAAAGAERKRRARDGQLEAMGTAIVGRDAELESIQAFLRSPPVPQHVSALYVSGIGGSGKSTLLLAAEKGLRATGNHAVVRLDFDSPYLDPLSPEQMDILFLRALAVEEPRIAYQLQRTIVQLQSLADHRVRARIEAEGGVQSSSSSRTLQLQANQMQRAKYATKSGSAAESVGLSQQYERTSALAPLRYMSGIQHRGVVLFLDTLENVSRLGLDAVDSVLQWLASIGGALPHGELRVVLAGRERIDSPNMRALADRFQEHGIIFNPDEEVRLLDLSLNSGCELLKRFGMPDNDAALAAAVLPRNPLVLRLAANAYHSNETDLAGIQEAYRSGRIDRQTASGYLAQRVIQHVPRQPARRYVVAAMALNEVTERMLRDIVIPAVDSLETAADRALARKVYEGLKRASWLTIEYSPGALRWHTELRELALPMIQADPHHAEIAMRVHSAAALWYEKQRMPGRRAMAEYHQTVAEKKPVTTRVLDRATKYISWLIDALPEPQSGFESWAQSSARNSQAELVRMRLEGVGGNAGEGDRLVAQGRAARALELYREQPTREPGVAPTFVIRALALTGDWHGGEVDSEKVLLELRHHFTTHGGQIQRQQVERLYWFTRLEMLRSRQLLNAHVELLRDVCRGLKWKQQNGALFGLVGTLEALQSVSLETPREEQGSRGAVGEHIWCIAPAGWPPPEVDVGPELRFSMVRTAYGQLYSERSRNRWISTTLGAMLLLDERWPEYALEQLRLEVLQFPGPESDIINLIARMRALRDAPLVEVEQFMASCRDLRVRVNLAKLAPELAAWLLRGTLVEFHSPLATVLSIPSLWSATNEPSELLLQLVSFVKQLQLQPNAVLTLAEFESDERRHNLARNIHAAISALVVALDRACTLAEFCRALCKSPSQLFNGPDPAATRGVVELCTRYIEWDNALNPNRPQGQKQGEI